MQMILILNYSDEALKGYVLIICDSTCQNGPVWSEVQNIDFHG